MKIYELRDITDDETYYTKGFFQEKETAFLEAKSDDAYQLSDDHDEYVRLAVYEWELDNWEIGLKKILEVSFTNDRDGEDDDKKWTSKVEFERKD